MNTEDFHELTALTKAYVTQEREVQRLEGELKYAKVRYREIKEESLPDLMLSLLPKDTILSVPGTNERIKIDDEVFINTGMGRSPDVHDWLDSTGNGSLVKRQIIVEFEREQQEQARGLLEALRSEGYPYAKEEGVVNYQSLLKLVKDRLAEDEDVPEDLLGVVVRQVAKFVRK